jgi:CheY-like chemotaxis protein
MLMSEPEVPNIVVAEFQPADVILVEQAPKIKCKVLLFSDGVEALRFSRDLDGDLIGRALDLLRLDFHLPKHDGKGMMRGVRASQRCAEMPVVVMRSSESPKYRAQALGGILRATLGSAPDWMHSWNSEQ